MILAQPIAAALRRPLRFVWASNSDDHFHIESVDFLAFAERPIVSANGKAWPDFAKEVGLTSGEHVQQALASQATWSAIFVELPIAGRMMPVELSAFPIFSLDGAFEGYRGFGLCREPGEDFGLHADRPAERMLREGRRPAAPDGERPDGERNVLPFPGAAERRPTLSPVESSAFAEIARALQARNGELEIETAALEAGPLAQAQPSAGETTSPHMDGQTPLAPESAPDRHSGEQEMAGSDLAIVSTPKRTGEGQTAALSQVRVGPSELFDELNADLSRRLSAILEHVAALDGRADVATEQRSREHLEEIRAAAVHMRAVLQEFAAVPEQELRDPQTSSGADLNSIIQTCIAAVQPQASSERILIRKSVSQEPARLRAEPAVVQRMVMNVMAHALGVTAAGGQIIVSSGVTAQQGLVIRVRNTGERLSGQRAMQPVKQDGSEQTLPSPEVSLTLARGLVASIGGQFLVQTKSGRGTIVEIAFPASLLVDS
jgi:signal transduction histidine kinase